MSSLENNSLDLHPVEQKLMEYKERVKSLAYQLIVTKEKKCRRIGTGLHDHLGQTLTCGYADCCGVQVRR